jgi:CrcB protein
VTPVVAVAIGLIGGVGALARFALDGAVASRLPGAFPYGTFVVNVLGSFVLGLLVGAALSPDALRLAGTGLLGSFTTFSTWMLETHRLGEDGQPRPAVANVLISLLAGLVSVWVGRQLGQAL